MATITANAGMYWYSNDETGGQVALPKRSIAGTRALMLRAATDLVCARVHDADEDALAPALAPVRLTDVVAHATRLMREETGNQDDTALGALA